MDSSDEDVMLAASLEPPDPGGTGSSVAQNRKHGKSGLLRQNKFSDISDISDMDEDANLLETARQDSEEEPAVRKRKLRKLNNGTHSQSVESACAQQTEIVNSQAKLNASPPGEPRKVNYPSNGTLISSDKNNTIVILQIDNGPAKLSHDPVGIAKGLEKLLNETDIADVRPNPRRNCVAVELKKESLAKKSILLELNQLGKYKVRCYDPSIAKKKTCSGVIGPLALDTDIQALMSRHSSVAPIININRLSKFTSEGKSDALVLKVDFEGDTLPEKIMLGYVSYNVREYNRPPLRCYRCQRPNHLADGCTEKERCLVCGGNHNRSICIASSPKCANCKQPHIASSGECIFNIEGKEISHLMKQGNSFLEARKKVIASKKSKRVDENHQDQQIPQLPTQQERNRRTETQIVAEVHNTQGSYHDHTTESDFEGFPSYRNALLSQPGTARQSRKETAQSEVNAIYIKMNQMLEKQEEKYKKCLESMVTQVGVLMASFMAIKESKTIAEEFIQVAETHLGPFWKGKIKINYDDHQAQRPPQPNQDESMDVPNTNHEQAEGNASNRNLRSKNSLTQDKSKDQAAKKNNKEKQDVPQNKGVAKNKNKNAKC